MILVLLRSKKETVQSKGVGALSLTKQDRLLFLIRRKIGTLKKKITG